MEEAICLTRHYILQHLDTVATDDDSVSYYACLLGSQIKRKTQARRELMARCS